VDADIFNVSQCFLMVPDHAKFAAVVIIFFLKVFYLVVPLVDLCAQVLNLFAAFLFVYF